jgi:hypothetical protein
MAVENPTSWRRTAESHFLALSIAVLLYFVLPPTAVVILSVAILAGFVVSELVSRCGLPLPPWPNPSPQPKTPDPDPKREG